jgi:hypothetical protein
MSGWQAICQVYCFGYVNASQSKQYPARSRNMVIDDFGKPTRGTFYAAGEGTSFRNPGTDLPQPPRTANCTRTRSSSEPGTSRSEAGAYLR